MTTAVLTGKHRNGGTKMFQSGVVIFRTDTCKKNRRTRPAHAAGGMNVDDSAWVEAGRA